MSYQASAKDVKNARAENRRPDVSIDTEWAYHVTKRDDCVTFNSSSEPICQRTGTVAGQDRTAAADRPCTLDHADCQLRTDIKLAPFGRGSMADRATI